MFVDHVEGAWIDVPLWFRSHRIDDDLALARLRDSHITALVIDLDKGIGPARETEGTDTRRPSPSTPPSRDPEVAKARETLRRSQSAMRQIFAAIRDGVSIDPGQARAVVDEVAVAMRHRPRALLGITRLKSKDEYSFLHSVAVCALMTHFGRFLHLDESMVDQLGLAGLLHDVGKVRLPSEILGKPGSLTEEEIEIVRTHPRQGFRILQDQDVSDMVRDVCLHHHERIDGRGYPDGLQGDQLSQAVRIAAICDVYDAVTSVRPYKEAWSAKTAYRRMWEWDGHFDRVLLGQFFVSIGVTGETSRRPEI